MSYPLRNKTKIMQIKLIMKRLFRKTPYIEWDNMILLKDYTIFFNDDLSRISIRILPSQDRYRIVQIENDELDKIRKQLLRLYASILTKS